MHGAKELGSAAFRQEENSSDNINTIVIGQMSNHPIFQRELQMNVIKENTAQILYMYSK